MLVAFIVLLQWLAYCFLRPNYTAHFLIILNVFLYRRYIPYAFYIEETSQGVVRLSITALTAGKKSEWTYNKTMVSNMIGETKKYQNNK